MNWSTLGVHKLANIGGSCTGWYQGFMNWPILGVRGMVNIAGSWTVWGLMNWLILGVRGLVSIGGLWTGQYWGFMYWLISGQYCVFMSAIFNIFMATSYVCIFWHMISGLHQMRYQFISFIWLPVKEHKIFIYSSIFRSALWSPSAPPWPFYCTHGNILSFYILANDLRAPLDVIWGDP